MIRHEAPALLASVTPCCGRTIFELPRADQVTTARESVTCGREEE